MDTRAKRIAHPWINLFAGAIALSAWAGAAGLATGVLDFGPAITARLPLHSGALAAAGLSLVVALPMTLAAWLCGRNHPQWRLVTAAAGALLVGWILMQVAVIRTFSWLQPLMATAGIVVVVCAIARRDRFQGPRSRS
ncbi:hypothetical protein ACSHWB_36480 [Lentzea sp. HUAS TT2]|uniref:hypothetical protein n=1 Tax=Lentzea sp. HUAS TT2 TaxID=3447454 RepID=UPI003F70D190